MVVGWRHALLSSLWLLAGDMPCSVDLIMSLSVLTTSLSPAPGFRGSLELETNVHVEICVHEHEISKIQEGFGTIISVYYC